MTRTITFLVLLLVVGAVVVPAPVVAAEDPRFETYVPEPTVAPGQTTQVTVQFLNDADEVNDQVKTARNVKATMLEGSTPFTVYSGTQLLGSIPDGQPVPARFELSAPEDIEPGTYRIPIRLTYDFDTDERETTTVYATVQVKDRPMFTLVDVQSDLTAGEQGSVSLTIQNDGTQNASAASVALQSKTGNVLFGTSATASSFVGDWAVGKNKTVTVDATAPDTAQNGTYAVDATVTYDDPDGNEKTSFPMTAGVTVGPETDRFLLENVESDLRVGEEGTVNMAVTNNGNLARNVVVHLANPGLNVNPLETQYALGTLEPGQSKPVSFPVEVSESAKSAPRQFSFTVGYETQDKDQRQTKPLNVRVPIAPERDRFTVTPVDATIQAGSSGTVTFRVTNNGDSPVSNVNAKLFANDPLSASDDEAFVSDLGPGESADLTFSVAVSGGALEKTYPLSMDFQYEEGGDSKLSKTYQVPVKATKPESGGLPITYIVVGVVIVAAAGAYLWYRRQ